jgi:hypothetical protein
MVISGTDRFGWVSAPARDVLETYYPPGQRYLGGRPVALTDEILVVKMHGSYNHSAPLGAKSTASIALVFYDSTTGEQLPSVQMWDGDAPDLGIGADPGITNRETAARSWDLRLLGTPTLRTI